MQPQPMDNSLPLTEGFNFTPLFNGNRVRMRISSIDYDVVASIRGCKGFLGTVTDQDTNVKYNVYGANCGLEGCYCDAIIKDEVSYHDPQVNAVIKDY